MKQKSAKKTFNGRSAQTIIRSIQIQGNSLVVVAPGSDLNGGWAEHMNYKVRVFPDMTNMELQQIGGWGGSAVLGLNEWTKQELLWWCAELDKVTTSEFTYLLTTARDRKIIARLEVAPDISADSLISPNICIFSFKLNNVLGTSPPKVGDVYVAPIAPVRPPRVRGPSVAT